MHRLAQFRDRYRAIFSIHEIEDGPALQWMFGAMLFFFYLTFARFIGYTSITTDAAERGLAFCWPYFQNCTDFYFLSALPDGYSQSTFYMALFGLMLLIVYWMWKKQWVYAHALMLFLLLWKVIVVFALNYTIAGVYDYYHIILTTILLFIPFKEYFLKLTFVFLYFLSVTTKFDPTWILGTYFSALKTGLPLFPDALTPLFTNIVIFSQVIGCWFLLSAKRLWQRIALAFFVFFHLYSGIFVYYLYPSIALPALLVLFGPFYRHTPTPFSWRALGGWSIIGLLLLFQLMGFATGADRRVTLESNRFGMFMFEANHQCVSTVRTYVSGERVASTTADAYTCDNLFCLTHTRTYMEGDTAVYENRYENSSAWNRCDPYGLWYRLNQRCALNSAISKIGVQFDHSINGGPFYRIIDVPDICSVAYRPFVHNKWIAMPPAAPIVGYPVRNQYKY